MLWFFNKVGKLIIQNINISPFSKEACLRLGIVPQDLLTKKIENFK